MADRADRAVAAVAGETGVDAIVSAWLRERPELDASPLHVLSRISRMGDVLEDRRRRIFAAHDLGPHEFDVLAALRRAGAPYELTPGQLMAQTHVTSGTMTNRLDGLTERQLIRRRPHPDDRRVTRIVLTSSGRRRVDAALDGLLAIESELLAGLSATQRETLAAALQSMLDVAARQR